MAFLPDGRLLVTEKRGALSCSTRHPAQRHRRWRPGRGPWRAGGLGDIAVHPHFADNGRVYLSYAETGPGDTRGAAVARARLVLDDKGGGRLDGLKVIWRQSPRSAATATTATACCSARTASCGSAPASGRSSTRRRTWAATSARSCA
jgi:glucose/arabinose dehydrogenase